MHYRTSRWSSRISATRCTTARWPWATPGSNRSCRRSCSSRTPSSSSSSTRERRTSAEEAMSRRSRSEPLCALVRATTGSRAIAGCCGRSRTPGAFRVRAAQPASRRSPPSGSESRLGVAGRKLVEPRDRVWTPARAKPARALCGAAESAPEGNAASAWNFSGPMLAALASAVAARDPYTAAHAAHVTFLAGRLAAAVSDSILQKPGPLDARDPHPSRRGRAADRAGRASQRRAAVRPLPPRAVGGRRLSDRLRRRRDPRGGAPALGRGRLRRDDLDTPLSSCAAGDASPRRDRALRGLAVRSVDRGGFPCCLGRRCLGPVSSLTAALARPAAVVRVQELDLVLVAWAVGLVPEWE